MTESLFPTGKPFLKWAGGKGQLIDAINNTMPNMAEINTYVEPFIGSGAILFWVLNTYPNIERLIINDINTDLINTYLVIRNNVDELIRELSNLESSYKLKSEEERKVLFLAARTEYNSRLNAGTQNTVRMAALFIFLNRTCFNGLYRVNSKNLFNVPFGKYANPKICDEDTLRQDSDLLTRVEILNGDYSQTLNYVDNNTLVYLDPPYKPISETSSFNSYNCDVFDDGQQRRLKEFCDGISAREGKFILSNSDPNTEEKHDTFFDDLYQQYHIKRVSAKRNINSKGSGRGSINELLITNFE